MDTRTHMYVGAAASLAIMQPTTVAGCLVNVVGGLLGGWICDIDLNTKSRLGDHLNLPVIVVPLAGALAIDRLLNLGIARYVLAHVSRESLGGLVAFVALFAYGATMSGHREFMHSILGTLLFFTAASLAFPPMAPPLAVGMLSHVLLDLFNKTGVRLLFLLRRRFCLGWCTSNGAVNRVVHHLSLAALIVLAALLCQRT